MSSLRHVPEAQLLSFLDRELPPNRCAEIEQHLAHCNACRTRFETLQNASSFYAQIHEHVLKPVLTPQVWPVLRSQDNVRRAPPVPWWLAIGVACLVIATTFSIVRRHNQSSEMQELLSRAEAVAPSPARRIQVNADGTTWLRPASLRSPQSGEPKLVQALFVRAEYDWADPLSARSFASWRGRLKHRRDHVERLQQADTHEALYRVRTDTADSTLRSASLTLRADDLAAIYGIFRFEQNRSVQMTDVGPAPQERTTPKATPTPLTRQPVTAAEELRVLAALDDIGADLNDAVTVATDADKQNVVVSGFGLRPSREAEIRQRLATVPRTVVRFLKHPLGGHPTTIGSAPYTADGTSATRRYLEERAGGPQAFETISDNALDASNALLSRAHALDFLAQTFPPDVEEALPKSDRALLADLRNRHTAAMQQSAVALRHALAPLAPAGQGTITEPQASWQTEAAKAYELARSIDDEVSRALDGAYSKEKTQAVLSELPHEIDTVDQIARTQYSGP